MDNKEEDNKKQPEKKPDDVVRTRAIDHVRIRDKDSGKELLNKRG